MDYRSAAASDEALGAAVGKLVARVRSVRRRIVALACSVGVALSILAAGQVLSIAHPERFSILPALALAAVPTLAMALVGWLVARTWIRRRVPAWLDAIGREHGLSPLDLARHAEVLDGDIVAPKQPAVRARVELGDEDRRPVEAVAEASGAEPERSKRHATD